MDRKQRRGESGLSAEELAAEQSQDLPDREAMSIMHFIGPEFGNIAMPINEAIAENYNTTQSIANASAEQIVIADQATGVSDPNTGGFPND
jgi:hypothetical protein